MMVGMMVFMYLANRQSKLVKSLARACAQNYTISIGIQTVGTTNIIIASLEVCIFPLGQRSSDPTCKNLRIQIKGSSVSATVTP